MLVENVITPTLALVTAALDRTRTSDQNAVYILTEAASSLGYNPLNA